MATTTMKDKMSFLNNNPNETTLNERVTSGVVFKTKNGRTSVKVDIRERIKAKMAENGISHQMLADRLGKPRANISSFLRGVIPIPLADIEEILWLIEDDNFKGE